MRLDQGKRSTQGLRLSLMAMVMMALLGCSTPTDTEWVRRPGTLPSPYTNPQALVVPATARVGVPFTITIATVGSGSCVRASGASVEIAELVASVTPMDERYVGSRIACTRDLASHPRTVTLTFHEAGTASVQVSGISLESPDDVLTLVRTVRVEP